MSTTSPRALYTLPTPCRCLQVPQAPPMNTISNVEAARLCGSSIEWAVTVKESRALGSGITGSLLCGSIDGRCNYCCKEQLQLSPPDSSRSLRWCHHARPGQNLDLSDPRAKTLRPHSMWTHRQGRAGGTVGAWASRAEHATVSVAGEI